MANNNDFVYDEEEFKRAARKSGNFIKKFGWIVLLAIVVLILGGNSTYQINEQ